LASHLFTGEQWDADLGMYFLRARYLNPDTGRFHTRDTYEGNNGEPLSLHKYLYANGNPVGYIDPSGHDGLLSELAIAEVGNEQIDASSGALNLSAQRGAQMGINRVVGKLLETTVETAIEEGVPTAELIGKQIALRGPGGARVLDLLYKIGERLVAIEVKTNLPFAGSSFARLIGQIKTYAIISESAAAGADILVATEGLSSEAALLKVEADLAIAAGSEAASSVKIIQGVEQLNS
jgi:RHS repeat-associated protein